MEREPEIGNAQCEHCGTDKCPDELERPSPAQDNVLLKVSELENNPMCRICYSGPSKERLLKPCKCKGTIEYVHRNCLERWLESTNCETCELCHHQFTTRRTRKSIWEWCRQPETRHDRRNFIGDFTCFAFLTPLGIATFWLCAEGAIYYQKVKNSTLETVALVTLAVFLVLAYVTWIVLCTRYHLMIWSRWRDHNWTVRIVDRQSTTPPPSVSSSETVVITVPPQASDRSPLISPTRLSPHHGHLNEHPLARSPSPYAMYISRVSTV